MHSRDGIMIWHKHLFSIFGNLKVNPTKMKSLEEKKAGLKRLLYEIEMFVGIFNKNLTTTPDSPIEYNVYLETFLLHARILIEFLTSPPQKKDLIAACEFGDNIIKYNLSFPEGSVTSKDDPDEKRLEVNPEINNYLSHLTWRRSREKKTEWETSYIAREILEKLEDFINKLSPEVFETPNGISKQKFIALLGSANLSSSDSKIFFSSQSFSSTLSSQ